MKKLAAPQRAVVKRGLKRGPPDCAHAVTYSARNSTAAATIQSGVRSSTSSSGSVSSVRSRTRTESAEAAQRDTGPCDLAWESNSSSCPVSRGRSAIAARYVARRCAAASSSPPPPRATCSWACARTSRASSLGIAFSPAAAPSAWTSEVSTTCRSSWPCITDSARIRMRIA